MSKDIVEVSDKTEKLLQIVVSRPLVGQDNWVSLNKGIWAYESGAVTIVDKTNYKIFRRDVPRDSVVMHKHLILYNTPHISREQGVILWDYLGWTGVNDSGTGLMRDGYFFTAGVSSNGFSTIKWKIIG